MPAENLASDIGRAWRYQREGKADSAIPEYERILKQDSKNIDANYGMGLAKRDAGMKDQAIQSFQTALSLVEAAASARNVNPGEANTPEDDRYMMLARMIRQRLSELGAPKQ